MGKKIRDWDKVKNALIKLYLSGQSLRELAQRYETTPVTISSWLSRWKINRRGTPHGGRKRQSILKPIVLGAKYKHFTVIKKDPLAYPARWLVKCDICSKQETLSEAQITRGRCKH